MSKDEIVDVLCEVARRAVPDSVTHPEDIAYAMTFAIETAGQTLTVLGERGRG